MILADLGAEVIKVENPKGGDDTRHWGPPYVGGESAYYLCANRGKQSVAVDLSHPNGQQLIRDLARRSDVVVENYKSGGLAKYGLDYDGLSAINQRLVYCSISGYGHASPLADRPGYDYVIQAEGGLMAVTGETDGQPMKVGVAVADLYTGMAAAQAILAGLMARDRDGVGQHIDMALFDCQLAMLANVASAALISGQEPRRYGNGHPTVVPYQAFDTADGRMVVAVGNDRQFAIFCRDLLGRPDIAADPRFAKNSDRVRNRDALLELLCPLMKEWGSDHWLAGLRAAGVPAGEVRTVTAALQAKEAAARGMVTRISHPTAGEVNLVASPLKLSGTPVRPPEAPPLLGQHTDAVLRTVLGLSGQAIAGLRAEGGIA